MSQTIPVNIPKFHGNELEHLSRCLKEGWISSEGPFVAEFEQRFAETIGRRHAVAVSSGTAALSVAVAALRLEPGAEVIVPALTIISCLEAIVRNRLKPVLVDSDPLTWNMDPADVARKITSRTRAIMIVHLYGLPADLDPILALAQKHGLKVIEDAAEMLGQTYREKNCGSFGDLSTFSFYPNKLLTTGEGGMVVTGDDELAERTRRFRNLCFEPPRRFVHRELGWNFRLTSLQAAFGLAQLEYLSANVRRKREIGARYEQGLAKLAAFTRPPVRTAYAENIDWVYGVVLSPAVSFDAERAMKFLQDHGVGTRPFFWPMHEQPVFRKEKLFSGERHPVAENLARRGLYLPSGLGTTDEQIDAVISACQKLFS
ncbi:MAG: DegT/DnrJ/EryC1/StrS family aminotransferase [Verrucomicrobiota bacterium]|nr:DegT/DnrJ/EryC1/StrS family aminotransferase [Verrucomicrobiota bacterium]